MKLYGSKIFLAGAALLLTVSGGIVLKSVRTQAAPAVVSQGALELPTVVTSTVSTSTSEIVKNTPKETPKVVVKKTVATKVSPKPAPAPVVVTTSAPDVQIQKDPVSNLLSSSGIVLLTNEERARMGLGTLAVNAKLKYIAEARLKDMFGYQYFSHSSPNGKDMATLAGSYEYGYRFMGENIAMGDYISNSMMVDGWMNSPGHRANILSENYTEIGVAVAKGMFNGREIWIGVQIFGKPR